MCVPSRVHVERTIVSVGARGAEMGMSISRVRKYACWYAVNRSQKEYEEKELWTVIADCALLCCVLCCAVLCCEWSLRLFDCWELPLPWWQLIGHAVVAVNVSETVQLVQFVSEW